MKAIVVAHGLFMRKEVMSFIVRSFEKKGYKVYNFNYNTRNFTGQTIENFKEFVNKIQEPNVYFIGHSLGGILIRRYFETYRPKFNDTCIVTLGTPHKGTSFGRKVNTSVFSSILGQSTNSGMLEGLGDWDETLADLGCVVGTMNVGLNTIFNNKKNAGDGTVLALEAVCENAKAIVNINSNHTALIYKNKTIEYIDKFIKSRNFIDV